MIKFNHTYTTLDKNKEKIEECLSLMDNCIIGAVINLNNAFDVFWGLPDNELLELLNDMGPTELQKVFVAHCTNALNLNALLAERGITDVSAIAQARRELTVDPNTGIISFVIPTPPIVEEPPVDVTPPIE